MGENTDLLDSVLTVNEDRVPRFVHRIIERFGDVHDKTFAILGLAFKANTDDMREAKSIEIIAALKKAGASIRAFDPISMDAAKTIIPDGLTYCRNAYEAAEGSDAAIIVTDWNEFKQLNLEKLKEKLKHPIIFDGRNIYKPENMKKFGFEYYSIGRK